MSTLVLVRHGQSVWNAENRFTGWVDVDLTPEGEREAEAAGAAMAAHGLFPDVVHTSVLTRAVRSANFTLDVLDRLWIPVRRSWRLNERHYGALQGLDKQATVREHGAAQVAVWRRSYDIAPPSLADDEVARTRHDPRYASVPLGCVPASESLRDVVARVVPYWEDSIAADLAAGRVVLVVAHGNSLRALVKHLKGISDDDIVGLNIAT
ncbi:MAG TPA: 2,3-bisphosphoglycerate-dependent phosphoglycerate mutase, partial [Acidimicrobiales bacterium]|nr:2,3-bisphosphoglycerate-dependent phosphoglycerate mutase [Acidimicrobiales bacterium]